MEPYSRGVRRQSPLRQLTDCTATKLPLKVTFHSGHLWNLILSDQRRWKKAQTANCNGKAKERGKYKCVVAGTSTRTNCVYFSRNSGRKMNNISVSHAEQEKYYVAFVKKSGLFVPCEARKFTEFYDTFTSGQARR